jgi:hypothetical protein
MTVRHHVRSGDTAPTVRLLWDELVDVPRDLTGCVADDVWLEPYGGGITYPFLGVLTGGDGFVDLAWDDTFALPPADTYRLWVSVMLDGDRYSWSPGDPPLVIVS